MFHDFRHPADQNAENTMGGYRLLYYVRDVNHCPGCGGTHWLVGRFSAECAFCATALPLDATPDTGLGMSEDANPVTH